jgi:hypothetical protein
MHIKVKIVEKCIPADKPHVENIERKQERINRILEKDTKSLTYAEWILAERLKHQQNISSQHDTLLSREETAERAVSPAEIIASREVSAAALSERLASSPKEDEVWATDCAVCLAEFGDDEQVRELPCDHIFHHECIHDWFMKAKAPACPLCRNLLHSGLSTDSITPQLRPTAPNDTENVSQSAADPTSASPNVVEAV